MRAQAMGPRPAGACHAAHGNEVNGGLNDGPAIAQRVCSECGVNIGKVNASGLCRSHRMKALHADPAFAERHRESRSHWMKALHADPAFAERHRQRLKALNADPAFNPLVALTEGERADYDKLKRRGVSRNEALAAVGRADLIKGQGA